MPTGYIERNSESRRALTPHAVAPHTLTSDSAHRSVNLEKHVGQLARQLLRLEASDREEALASAVDALGHGFSCDSVCFFSPVSGTADFEVIAHWDRWGSNALAGADPCSIDLASLPGQGARLGQGEILKVGGAKSFSTGPDDVEGQPMTGWSSSRTSLYVPCVGPGGLLGFFRVDGGLAASRWSEAVFGQATLVGCLVSNFLERHRLTAELAASRLRRGHDEGLESLGRVASSVAHDFNNVLTAILGYADLLEMEMAEKSPGRIELTEIRNAATRAAELVEQVLCFGRCRRSGPQPVDLAKVLTKLEGMLQRVIGEGTCVDLQLANDLDPISVDPGRLERMILNLASNARDALGCRAGSGGHFELSTCSVTIDPGGCDSEDEMKPQSPVPDLRPGQYVRLTARDNGCGIDPSLHERIFEPFFTTKASGTGLGLASVADLLREAHGAIRIQSESGQGTSFHLYFPV